MIAQISVGDDALDFSEGTLAVGSSYAVGKSSDSQQPSMNFCARENDSLTPVDCQDLSGADAIVDAFDSFSIEGLSSRKDEEEKDALKLDDIIKLSPSCDNQAKDTLNVINSSDSFTLKESEENVATEVDGASETKCVDVTSSSPLYPSSFENNLDQASWNRRPVRNCRNKANQKVLLNLSSLQILRRRRSSLSKQARSRAWGLLSNIESRLERNSGTDVSPDNTKRSRAPRVVQGNCKQENKKAARSFKKLRQMKHAPTGIISIKVKFGKHSALTTNVLPVIAENKGDKDTVSENPSPEDCKILMEKEAPDGVHFLSTDDNSERASELHLSVKDSKRNVDRNTADDLCDCPCYEDIEKVGGTYNRALDSENSPDSEVINLLPDSQISRKDSEGLHCVADGSAVIGNACGLTSPWQGSEQERRTDELHEIGDCCQNGQIPSPGNLIKLQEFAKLGEREKMSNGSYFSDASNSTSAGNTPNCASDMVEFNGETLPTSAGVEFGNCCKTSHVEMAMEAGHSATLGEQRESTDSLLSQRLLPCLEGQKQNKKSRAKKMAKSKSGMPNLKSGSDKASKKKVNRDRSVQKGKNKEVVVGNQISHEVDNLPEIGNLALSGIGECGETCKKNPSTNRGIVRNSIEAGKVAEKCTLLRNAWVSCDDCHKWRRIPAALADKIEETDSRWVCKDNKDKEFARCAIPQEKSNAEINAELEISDASCEEDACDLHLTSNKPRRNQSRVNEQSPWTLIKSNLFLHRRRKTQSIDEIMVCGCKKPLDNRMGCGAKCLNRMLNIECIPGTCPCGESCSNQQFQKRKYAHLKSFKCGKKGYGLQLQEDVSEGQFLIEYVGEVLDMHSYEARQRDYAFKGHKHFYFMTLNGSEVIDACAKGNLGRFINHSCDPNCRTEKWMVNGEVCIGIFALRDIKKGEEVTFDYNYVRVFGAAAKKCVCGSSQCRGYIGGDPLNSDVIVQGDSDEEYPEPVMVCEDDGTNHNLTFMKNALEEKEVMTSKESFKQVDEISEKLCNGGLVEISSDNQTQEMFSRDEVEIDNSISATGQSDITKESRVPMAKSPSISLKIKISRDEESSVGQHASCIQSSDGLIGDVLVDPEDCSATEKSKQSSLSHDAEPEKSLPDIPDIKKKLKPSGGENEVVLTKSRPRTKISGKLLSDKKKKSKTDAGSVKKGIESDNSLHVLPLKPKRLLEDPSNGNFEADRFEAVQQKLNELLDSDGGISKRKDASRGYLKLLLLTAASGDGGNGEAIQSNRDLSMILDALLKTKSRTVLVDVINKNGLQMLHNIMKRYRREFIKIPILRKLLKVLEYLATREILTSEHINGGPRCPGVESFRDSILTLTEHNDKQVHQIARNFRDRWIPRCFRKYGNMDREDCRVEFHRGLSHEKFQPSHNNWNDQYAKTPETPECGTKYLAASGTIDVGKVESSSASQNTRKRKSRWDQPHKGRPDLIAETAVAGDGANNMDEDVPPGFSSPQNASVPSSDTSSNAEDHPKKRSNHEKCPNQVAVGHTQQRFISRISVAYGVPISIVQQFGIPRLETSGSWIIAPGIPFQPFPPLPQYPRVQGTTCSPGTVAQKAEQNFHDHVTSDSSQSLPTTSAVVAPDSETSCGINQLDFQQTRGNLGRRYFRQQKWNNSKLAPPWVRMRNGWNSSGINARNGMCPPGFGSGPIEYNSQDMSPGVQNGSTTHQYPQHNWN